MPTTGLLSLSVHEALTFEGTEIVLHPDLFNETTGSRAASVRPGSGSASVASLQPSHHRRVLSNDPPTKIPIAPIYHVPSTDTRSTADEGLGKGGETQQWRRLEVGNMIEIRVWNPIIDGIGSPHHRSEGRKHHQHVGALTPASSIIRKRASPPSSSAQNSCLSTPITSPKAEHRTAKTLEAAATFLKSKHQQGGFSPLVTQYSADSPLQSPGRRYSSNRVVQTDSDDLTFSSSDHGSSKQKIVISSLPSSPKREDEKHHEGTTREAPKGGSGIPPPFPRFRTNAAGDGGNPLPPKPPMIQRARTGQTSMASLLSKPPYVRTHSRDISDMTMDTMLAGVPFVASESDLVAAGHAMSESHDDEDDTLTKLSATHTLRLSFVMLVTEKTLTSMKGSSRSQVSILRAVADLYNLSAYDMVTINRIDKTDEEVVMQLVSADFCSVTIKNQFISRGDMHFFQKSLVGKWIYEGERLSDPVKGVKAHAREIRHGNRLVKSGIITEDTMITFRSRSARIMWLVQISSEMWEFASPYGRYNEDSVSEIYFDKCVGFMYKLFKRWKELEVTHSLTIVFFSRTFVGSNESGILGSQLGAKQGPSDVYGRQYEDHFRIVVENETSTDWDNLIVRIKREFVRYPVEVGWTLPSSPGVARRPSTAAQGNVLEAINVTLNLLQFHFLDRDLHRTGNSIVVVSPGNGVFEVDRGLAGITYQRMMDNGIGSDMVSLGLPPLHIAPFFLYNNDFFSVESKGVDTEKSYYEVPHWMHLSFVRYSSEEVLHARDDELLQDESNPGSQTEQIQVGANGFLLRRCAASDFEKPLSESDLETPTRGPLSTLASATTVVARNEAQPQNKQRQLISGRDFQDILEACRPRNSSRVLAPALEAVIKHFNDPKESTSWINDSFRGELQDETERTGNRPDHQILREWGSISFDESVISGRAYRPIFGANGSVVTTRSPILSEGNEQSDSTSEHSSASSSFASHLSNALARSAEKGTPLFSFQASGLPSSTKRGETQLQRTPSIDFDLDSAKDDSSIGGSSKGNRSDDSLSTLGGDDRVKDKTQSSNTASMVERLKKMMKKHDRNFFNAHKKATSDVTTLMSAQVPQPVSPNRTVLSNLDSQGGFGSLAQMNSSGGLDAALKQYNEPGDVAAVGNNDFSAVRRVVNAGRLPMFSGGSQSFGAASDGGVRPASPYFPSIGVVIAPGEPPDSIPKHRPNSGVLPDLTVTDSVPRQQKKQKKHTERTIPLLQRAGDSAQFTGAGSVERAKPISPLREKLSTQRSKGKKQHEKSRVSGRGQVPTGNNTPRNKVRQKKSAFNPFRERDEEEVLAKKSHNRRRWSHVFPLGEAEFKRHAGPNWKSLCQPAILPLTIDYFPTPQELKNPDLFQSNPYQLVLSGLVNTSYTSSSDMLQEFVRQRLSQDYQVVPKKVMQESMRVGEIDGHAPHTLALPDELGNRKKANQVSSKHQGTEGIRHCLSMGHRIHILSYDPTNDAVNVTLYNAKIEDDPMDLYSYRYMLYSPIKQQYVAVQQTFKKYSSVYRWNRVDNLVCYNDNKTLDDGLRFRRIAFGLIPPDFNDGETEEKYLEKFQRLLEYLGKLRVKAEEIKELGVKIVTGEEHDLDKVVRTARRGTTDEMVRFVVNFRKGKRDPHEWVEIAVDAVFHPCRCYRILFNWLVASTNKVEKEVQLLQRRCTQYGLHLETIPQTAISRDLFLNPLRPPTFFVVNDVEKAKRLDAILVARQFVDDGIHMTNAEEMLDCIPNRSDFTFIRDRRGQLKPVPGRQYVHRPSISLFIRLIRDQKGSAILVGIYNRRLVKNRSGSIEDARVEMLGLVREVESLVNDKS